MTNSIYISTTEPHSGKSLVSLGIADLLLRRTRRVAIFRPIIGEQQGRQRDKNIDLLLRHFNLPITYEDTFAFTKHEANELISKGQYDDVLDRIIEKYKALESQFDFVLCIGSDFVGEGSAFEFDINADIAKNLGSPVLIIGNAANRDIEEIVTQVQIAVDLFRERECQILGTVVNRADPETDADLLVALYDRLPEDYHFISVIPAVRSLSSPTMRELAEYLDAEVLYGNDRLENPVHRYSILAMQLQHCFPRLAEKALIITPGDRGDVILGSLQAHQSENYPQIAGILLTNGLHPAASVTRLLDGLPDLVPILYVDTGTYTTSTKIGAIQSYITANNQSKIALSLKLFEAYVDTQTLENLISAVEVRGLTPRMFIYNLTQQAKAQKQHIVLPEGTDERILKAAEILVDQNIVEITILGNKKEVKEAIRRYGRNLNQKKVSIVEPRTAPQFFDYVHTLYQQRKDKGLTLNRAKDLMCDVSYFGTMMVYKGHADGMVSGAAHTTQHTILPALQFIKTKPGVNIVSSVFFMCLEDRVLVYGDCAVNPNPTAEQLAEIAVSSADTSRKFGIEPKVAMLSYSSGESGKGEEVEKVRAATEIARKRRLKLLIEGPIQYDAAVDENIAKKKMPGSSVAGQATVLIFPDLNTGNNTYKAVQRETGAIAIGPILQGLNKPVNDLSRGATVEDIINTVIITAIQAQGEEQEPS